MKFLATIREFTSILFNKSTGDDVEIKPASTSKDAAANISYDLPDGSTPAGDADDTLVLAAETQTLSNKSIDSDNNTITNIVDADIKALAAIDSTKIADGSVDNTEFEKLGTAGTNATGELVTTDGTQTMSNKTFTSPTLNSPVLDTPLINDLSDDNTYTVTPSELSTDVNVTLPALSTSDSFVFEAHSQTLTNKTIDADNNTISNLAHGAEVDNPSSGVHGVTGSVVGTTDAQTLTNKSIDADNNTITNIDNADIKASAAIEFSKMENLSSNFALLSDGSGDVAVSTVTSTELTQLAGNTFGGSTSGDVVTVDGTQTLSAKTISELKYNETNIARTTSVAKPSETIIHLTGTAGDVEALTGGADGDVRILINETAGTVSLTEDTGAAGFHTGSGADLDLLQNAAVQVVYEATVDRWRVIGGSGGSGGGLTLAGVNSAITASANIHYLTTAGPYTITLPAGGAGDIIRFTDADNTWHTGNITLTPDGAETIEGDTELILDVQGTWVQLMWDGSEWVYDDAIVPQSVDITGDFAASGTITGDQGILTKDSVDQDFTVPSGYTLTHPFLTIESGVTYTNNGSMHVAGDLTVVGTLIDNGTIVNGII